MLKSYKIKLYIYFLVFFAISALFVILHQEMNANIFNTIMIYVFCTLVQCVSLFCLGGSVYLLLPIFWVSFVVQFMGFSKTFKQNHLYIREDALILSKVIERMKENTVEKENYSYRYLRHNEILDVVSQRITKKSWFTLADVARNSIYYNHLFPLLENLHALENSSEIMKDPEQRQFIRMLIPICLNCDALLSSVSHTFPKTADELKAILKEGSK